jgi:hypothetical protein
MASAVAAPVSPAAKKAASYQMPPIEVGNTVLFWFPGQTEGHAAVVTQVGDWTIAMSVLAPNVEYPIVQQGVKHASDPRRGELDTFGVWDYTPEHKRILKMLNEFEQLKNEIGGLGKR